MKVIYDEHQHAVDIVENGVSVARISYETGETISGDSRTYLEDAVRTGTIKAVKHGRATRLTVPSFLDYLNSRPTVQYVQRIRGTGERR